MLNSRRLKSKLPTAAELLQPRMEMDAREKLLAAQEKQKFYYDRHAKPLQGSKLEEESKRKWLLDTFSCHGCMVYMVKTESGNTLQRNRRHLMKEPEPSLSLESEEESTPSATVSSERTIVEPPTAAWFNLITPSPSLFYWDGIASHQEWPNCQSLLIGLIYEHLTRVRVAERTICFLVFVQALTLTQYSPALSLIIPCAVLFISTEVSCMVIRSRNLACTCWVESSHVGCISWVDNNKCDSNNVIRTGKLWPGHSVSYCEQEKLRYVSL